MTKTLPGPQPASANRMIDPDREYFETQAEGGQRPGGRLAQPEPLLNAEGYVVAAGRGAAAPCLRWVPRQGSVRGLCEVGDEPIRSAVLREVLTAAVALLRRPPTIPTRTMAPSEFSTTPAPHDVTKRPGEQHDNDEEDRAKPVDGRKPRTQVQEDSNARGSG
jgi:hypothetical protein